MDSSLVKTSPPLSSIAVGGLYYLDKSFFFYFHILFAFLPPSLGLTLHSSYLISWRFSLAFFAISSTILSLSCLLWLSFLLFNSCNLIHKLTLLSPFLLVILISRPGQSQQLLYKHLCYTAVSGPNKAYMDTISKELKLINIWLNVVIMAQEYQ